MFSVEIHFELNLCGANPQQNLSHDTSCVKLNYGAIFSETSGADSQHFPFKVKASFLQKTKGERSGG